MENTSNELPFLNNLGLMLTFRCPITCPHCIVNAGPARKEHIPLENCLAWINEARNYKDTHIQGLALTGGEPFHNLEDLKQISQLGKHLRFIISAVTNAYWATSLEKALQILSQLPDVHMISISTDIYHQKYIPLEYVKHAIKAAKKLGKLYNIAICTEDFQDAGYLRIKQSIQEMGEDDRIRESIITPVGRAKNRTSQMKYQQSPEPTKAACTAASSPVIFPNGKVSACIGPALTLSEGNPLILGNLYKRSLTEILHASETNPILHTLRVWGPHKLVELLIQHGFEDLLPDSYIQDCVCDVCYKLMSNVKTVSALRQIFKSDHKLREKTAYARLYYLDEANMIEDMLAKQE